MSFFKKKNDLQKEEHKHVSVVDMNEILSYEDSEEFKNDDIDSNEPIFKLNNVSLGYGKKMIIKNLTATIHRNDFVVVLGPNGSGKSTLIKGLCRINNPSSGYIMYRDKLISRPLLPFLWLEKAWSSIVNIFTKDRKEVIETIDWHIQNYKKIHAYKSKELALNLAYVPQLAVFPEATSIYDFVKMGRFPSSNALGINTNTEREKQIIDEALKNVGIYEFRHKNLEDLSGGQKQKALIALALAQDTETIVLDEPTNHLDIRSQLEIIELLHKLHHEMKKTIVLVIHDINNGLKYAHKVMIMKNGEMVRYGKLKETIDHEILLDVFGVESIIVKNESTYPQVSVTDFSLPKDYKINEIKENEKTNSIYNDGDEVEIENELEKEVDKTKK